MVRACTKFGGVKEVGVQKVCSMATSELCTRFDGRQLSVASGLTSLISNRRLPSLSLQSNVAANPLFLVLAARLTRARHKDGVTLCLNGSKLPNASLTRFT